MKLNDVFETRDFLLQQIPLPRRAGGCPVGGSHADGDLLPLELLFQFAASNTLRR